MKKIKTVTSYIVAEDNKQKEITTFLEYNEQEKLICSINYFSAEEIESKIVLKYDSAGNKTEEISYMSETEIDKHVYFKYDEKGNLLAEEICYADGSKSVKTYTNKESEQWIETRDEDGELEEKIYRKLKNNKDILEETVYDEEEKQTEKQINTYDKENRLTNRLEFGRKNEFLAERKYTYNEAGKIIKRLSVNKKGKLIDAIAYVYDDEGRILEQSLKNHLTIKYEYNKEEKTITEKRFLANGIMASCMISKFDENNLLVEEDNMISKKIYAYTFFE
ncbi:MAG: hypothetical protein CSA05_02710 [Bacteroidia bacterium]|nr:MAG: hypothetical protein CSA05_02710 [Bacteroidia bacterium]